MQNLAEWDVLAPALLVQTIWATKQYQLEIVKYTLLAFLPLSYNVDVSATLFEIYPFSSNILMNLSDSFTNPQLRIYDFF